MGDFPQNDLDLTAIRERIRRMDDATLIRHARAGAILCQDNDREPSRVRLAEARAEWKRRHPDPTPESGLIGPYG